MILIAMLLLFYIHQFTITMSIPMQKFLITDQYFLHRETKKKKDEQNLKMIMEDKVNVNRKKYLEEKAIIYFIMFR